jgi:diacylglycerol kinase family enzyme
MTYSEHRHSLGLIVNLAARGVRRRWAAAPFWRGRLTERQVRLTRDIHELHAALAGFRAAGMRVVAALGGDGTLHQLVNALFREGDLADAPAVLPLAGGTMNGLAHAFGTGGPPARTLDAAIAALDRREPAFRTCRLLRVNAEPPLPGRLGFGFAAGLVFRAFESYHRRPDPGLVEAIRASLLPLGTLLRGFDEALAFDVEADGQAWLPEPAHSLAASVVHRPVLWFEPFGPPLADPGLFHLAATSLQPRELIPRLWAVYRGRCRHPRLRTGAAREVRFRASGGYVLDGELYRLPRSTDLTIGLGPTIRLLVPARKA